MTNRDVRKRAYLEASALLSADMDSADLCEDLSEEDESRVREYIREHVTRILNEMASDGRDD